MAAQAHQNLQRMGLQDTDLANSSFNTGRKQLEAAGFEWKETTETGRQIFRNPKTGAEVYYDSGKALMKDQSPHWHIRDSSGVGYDRSGRVVGRDEDAAHIPGG